MTLPSFSWLKHIVWWKCVCVFAPVFVLLLVLAGCHSGSSFPASSFGAESYPQRNKPWAYTDCSYHFCLFSSAEVCAHPPAIHPPLPLPQKIHPTAHRCEFFFFFLVERGTVRQDTILHSIYRGYDHVFIFKGGWKCKKHSRCTYFEHTCLQSGTANQC